MEKIICKMVIDGEETISSQSVVFKQSGKYFTIPIENEEKFLKSEDAWSGDILVWKEEDVVSSDCVKCPSCGSEMLTVSTLNASWYECTCGKSLF